MAPPPPKGAPAESSPSFLLGVQSNPWIDTSNREAVRTSYLAAISATEGTPMGWTGNIAGCAEGTSSNAYQAAAMQRANWFRGMAGVPNTVTLDPSLGPGAAKAALIMSANRSLSHFPPSSWNCYSSAGYASAGKSNICLRWNSPDLGCVAGYIQDTGTNNAAAGHRRWILYPQTTAFGMGEVDQTGSFSSGYPMTNAMHVIQDSTVWSARPATRDPYVAWPPKGYVPYRTVYARWHFSYPGANFSNATVSMTQAGSPVSVAIDDRTTTNIGENSIVWVAAGLNPNSSASIWPQPSSDTTVRVTVSNVLIGNAPQSFTYDVIIFDPGTGSGGGGGGGGTVSAPTTPTPSEGATGAATNVSLSWTGSAAATAYDLFFGTTQTPQILTTITGTSHSPGALQPNTVYYWRVAARNATSSASSPLWTFTTGAGQGGGTSAPTVTAPSPGQTILTSGVTFSWNAVAGSGGYNLKITRGATTVFEGNLAGAASTSSLITLDDGAYGFSVRSCVGGFASSNCGSAATVTFTVSQPKPTSAPTIIAPAAGASFNTSTHQFSWTAVPNVGRYEILLRDMAAGAGTTELSMANAGAPPPTNTTFSMKSSSNYQLEVRACSQGCGPWSAPVNFSVTLPPVPAQAPLLPGCNVLGNQAQCVWNDVPNADIYVVEAVQSGAGPGGGALTVASARVSSTSATLSIPQGSMVVVVKACNGNGCGPYSPAANVNSAGSNPSAPVLGNPIGGSAVNGPLVFFSWNRIPGDNGSNTLYRLYVQDFSLSKPALDILTRNNYWAAMFRGNGNRYDALVIANPGSGQVAGPALPFHVRGSDPASPTLVEPRHQDVGVTATIATSGNFQLGWTPIGGATLYEYYVAAAGNPSPIGRGVTPSLNVQIPLAGAGQYSGIVRACPAGKTCAFNSDANWGPWSNAPGGTGVTTFQVQ